MGHYSFGENIHQSVIFHRQTDEVDGCQIDGAVLVYLAIHSQTGGRPIDAQEYGCCGFLIYDAFIYYQYIVFVCPELSRCYVTLSMNPDFMSLFHIGLSP